MAKAVFTAAGGANFIGASAYILKLGSKNLSIDWGQGVSQNSPDGPQYDGHLDYLLISHGHTDHVGLLPAALRRWPHLKIFATKETKEIAKTVWHQTIHRYRDKNHFDSNRAPALAPFTENEALFAEKAIIVINPGEILELGGEIKITPIPAGHILGAVSFRIDFEGETYFFSGDTCFHESFFVPGAPLYSLDRCRLLVRESVYLNEDFEDRQKIIEDFQQAAAGVLDRGGQLLVPALSIHRTQEMYAIAVTAGLGPVYVDGSRGATKIYQQYAPRCGEILENIPRFSSHHERTRLIRSEEPAIIIASSGMVYENTLSAIWAENLLFREKCAIFTVNYQDPCGQGFVLNNSRKGQYIPFNGGIIQRLCEIRHFPLSAHMDKTDGQEMEERLNPDVVVYTHGEDKQIEKYIKANPATANRKKIKAELGKEIEL
ncbi:MAG: MBL fold metallo-hydrolase [Candidatus Yanofskybacteria bacterium]|nr:MBL fold metallo-hydrolase [Candidatus Yanofskybacteria bacterium]